MQSAKNIYPFCSMLRLLLVEVMDNWADVILTVMMEVVVQLSTYSVLGMNSRELTRGV